MPTVIPVKFKYASTDLWFDPGTTEAIGGDHVICETERGQEIGLATDDAREVSYNELKHTVGEATLRPVLRVATDEDLDRAASLADQGDAAMPAFRRLVEAEGLDMKPVGVEYLFDGNKVVCYFSADERVDFRSLVRALSRELHQRIDMRQIGVREEAAIVGGFGHCGQELCCARFGHQFEPVSIRMAKEQDLPLNSSKISGACGRLMCCLRYEFEAYRDFKQRAPKRNAVIDTPLGKAKIAEYDTPKEQLTLRLENGKQVRVNLADMVASDAARKKSEELHCPCRPDTVTREALEHLQSPDVQMALAELDRKNGVIPEETFDASDIFVEPKPRRRRSSGSNNSGSNNSGSNSSGSNGNAGSNATSVQVGEKDGAPSRRRRRRKGSQAGAANAGADQQQKAASDQPQGKRRARRSSQAGQAGQAQEVTAPQPSRHRRHHHTAGEGGAQPANQAPRQRRHPGDHGGESPAAPKQPAPKHERTPDAAEGQQPSGEGKRRRRRRRHSGGNGNPASE